MTGRPGAARLALTTGVPVIPVCQVGTDALLGRKKLEFHRLFSLRRRSVMVQAGPPVDLSAFPVGEEPAREDVERASVAIMDAITAVVAELRGGPAPEGRWDMRVGARVPQRG